ncbi:hypothetical protein OG379_40980 (plasmid) [Streptomyces sp. NBC_01166]|uniref:hypothetical protein n=1 Tax=Streptomyces sp. NBC_01166 TaxID=2903755 RepID=UPI002F9145DD|nr:hypothetical protein OG379_40980 [Streptomyces sp. NBC_01166]
MTTAIHEPVMELLRAALDPASHRTDARSPIELPTGRLVAAAAHADADAEGIDRLTQLAAGTSMAALGLTAELAARNGQSPAELLDAMDRTAREHGHDEPAPVVQVVRSMLEGPADEGAELLGRTFARDQGDFLTLLLELATYCGTSIMILEKKYDTPKEQTLQDLENALTAWGDQA